MPGSHEIAVGHLDTNGMAVLHMDLSRLRVQPDLAAARFDRGRQRSSQCRRSANAHLSLVPAGEERRNMMSESRAAEIDFAQSVKEEQAGLNYGIFELACREFERREPTYFEQPP